MAPLFTAAGYNFNKKVSEGSNGHVFFVSDATTGAEYVAKVLPKKSKNVTADNVPWEIEIMSILEHNNVIALHEWIECADNYIVIMEKGTCDLMDLVSNQALDDDLTKRIFFGIVQGLKSCHDNDVAHLDLKPENIFLDDNFQPKLGDFGSSYFWDRPHNPSGQITGVVGTRFYYAPEVYTPAYDPFKADIFSLGVLFYVMVTSTWPYPGDNYDAVKRNASKFRVCIDRNQVHKFSPEAFHLVSWMLTKDPAQRPTLEQVHNHSYFRQLRAAAAAATTKPVLATATTAATVEALSKPSVSVVLQDA